MSIPVVVLTGGPQGGKTSALDAIRQEFADKVVVIPEAATTLLASYPLPGRDVVRDEGWLIEFQKAVIQTQLVLEKSWIQVAAAKKARLIVADRGLLDSLAYLPEITGKERLFMTLAGMSIGQIHSRYDAVIHLESVAMFAPEKFGKIGNSTRYESSGQAVAVEMALREAWKTHPNWNFVSGEAGVSNVIDQVMGILGKYVYLEHERKFFLQSLPSVDLSHSKNITQGYFETTNGELRLRNEAGVITLGIKSDGGLSRMEWEKPIPGDFYQTLIQSCPYKVVKSRYDLVDEQGRKWEVDVYHEDLIGLITAECEFADADEADNLELPDWLEGAVDVTDNPEFKNKNLARYGLPDMARATFQ